MIWALHGKSRYGESKAVKTLFDSLASSCQEAYTMSLNKNGFQVWVWMDNGPVSSAASEISDGNTLDGSPGYTTHSKEK
jgi:hypothetical protein